MKITKIEICAVLAIVAFSYSYLGGFKKIDDCSNVSKNSTEFVKCVY